MRRVTLAAFRREPWRLSINSSRSRLTKSSLAITRHMTHVTGIRCNRVATRQASLGVVSVAVREDLYADSRRPCQILP